MSSLGYKYCSLSTGKSSIIQNCYVDHWAWLHFHFNRRFMVHFEEANEESLTSPIVDERTKSGFTWRMAQHFFNNHPGLVRIDALKLKSRPMVNRLWFVRGLKQWDRSSLTESWKKGHIEPVCTRVEKWRHRSGLYESWKKKYKLIKFLRE